ncbi:MAG TPA: ribokinase [Acetobacteraceae bacterium]|nr:ribokinase [Acetobacteraceae bacterium]
MIVVFGSINLDLIFPLAALPAAGETVLGPDVRVEPGGKGANQALAAARDGARVVLAGATGRDPLATAALALLREAGVDLARVAASERATGCAAIFVDRAGRNAIGVGSGANLAARADQVEDALLGPDATLVAQMEVPSSETAALIRRARARGSRIVLNLAPAAALDSDALRAVDVLVVNAVEAAWLAGTLPSAPDAVGLHAALGVTVVRTLGEQGAEAAHRGELIRVPAHPVNAVDTTGAGDCFTGVLAAALDRGNPLEPALARASVAAALCCTRAGSQATMPWGADIDAASLPLRPSGRRGS